MKSIIIFYSKSGRTEKIAKKLLKDTGSDIIQVKPKKEYGNYAATVARVVREKIMRIRPAFINSIPDLSEYDTVFIGYPIWASAPPAFMCAFLRQCDLKDKTVIPFATSGMTNISSTLVKLKESCRGCTIKYPYNHSNRKKDDYDEWKAQFIK